jgi:hypothetical protein
MLNNSVSTLSSYPNFLNQSIEEVIRLIKHDPRTLSWNMGEDNLEQNLLHNVRNGLIHFILDRYQNSEVDEEKLIRALTDLSQAKHQTQFLYAAKNVRSVLVVGIKEWDCYIMQEFYPDFTSCTFLEIQEMVSNLTNLSWGLTETEARHHILIESTRLTLLNFLLQDLTSDLDNLKIKLTKLNNTTVESKYLHAADQIRIALRIPLSEWNLVLVAMRNECLKPNRDF